MDQLSRIRALYARQMLAKGGVADDAALEAAFAAVPREDFLGPPPWTLLGWRQYETSDPALLYQDVLAQLQGARGVNNGSPSLHARWLHALSVEAGASVAHIGAGAGYYSAILSRLVGEGGRVLAVECDPELAAAARSNLAAYPNVTVVQGDGADWPKEPVDRVYVNFGAQRPAAAWLGNLAPGGRLIFPLCAREGFGAALGGAGVGVLIERRERGFAAKALESVVFVLAEGALAAISQEEADRLRRALRDDGAERVRSLIWPGPAPAPQRCWLANPDWALSYDEP